MTTQAVTKLFSFLQSRLFPSHHALNLAVIRLIVGGYAVWFLRRFERSITRTCTETSAEFFRPVGVASLLDAPLDNDLFLALYALAKFMSFLFLIGAFFRLSGPIFGILLLFIVTYRQSWGFIYHTENLLVLHVAILGFALSAQTLSADELMSNESDRLKRLLGVNPQAPPSWRFGWPVALMVLLTGITYWVAGMAKLGRSGFAWVQDAHLLDHVGNNALRYHLFSYGASDFTYLAYSLPDWVWPALGLMSLCMELGAPLAILSDSLAVLFAIGLFGFHWGVMEMMGIPFLYQLYGVCYACFIRWDRLYFWLRGLLEPRIMGKLRHGSD